LPLAKGRALVQLPLARKWRWWDHPLGADYGRCR